jgi:hypothetical protein
MPDEFAILVATALATKGAEAAIAGTRSAVGALARLVRRRGDRGRTATALDRAIAAPGDRQRTADLAEAIAAAMAADPRFAAQVRARWEAVAADEPAGRGAVVNHVSGTADKVVQARDIHGDVRL